MNYKNKFTLEEETQIKNDYLSGLSIRKICEKYEIKSKEYVRKLLNGILRSTSEASKIAHKLYPDCFK